MNNSAKQLWYLVWFFGTIAGLIFSFELYYTNYDFIQWCGLNWNWGDLYVFPRKLFSSLDSVNTRYVILGLSLFFILNPTPPCTKTKTIIYHFIHLIIIGILFISISFIPRSPKIFQFLYICASLYLFLRYIIAANHIAAYWRNYSTSLSENEITADGFAQMTEKIETPTSANLPYRFRYKMKNYDGWINLISLDRGTTIIGTPGSGKSFSILDPIMCQLIRKGFTAVIYDYKDPTLSLNAYYYWNQYLKIAPEDEVKTRFASISFKDINRTYRCNPIKNITSSAEALDVANAILVALNPASELKAGEFFTESAEKYVAVLIYSLGLIEDGRYQTLPHVLSLLGSKSEHLFPCLNAISTFIADMKNIFNTFKEAADNGAMQQLQGQIASAAIGLGAMNDGRLSFVMTESADPNMNITLDINSPVDPKILCLGNDSSKNKIYGLANSIYLSRIATVANKGGCRPCMFSVDELPTVYIKGIDNLIGTGRSNGINVLLSYQDYSQIRKVYGDKISNAIISLTANILSGSVKGETAKNLAESFGEKIILKKSISRNANGEITTSFQEHKEKRLPADRIEELSQGCFVGRIADTEQNPIEHKVVHGKITVVDAPPRRALKKIQLPKLREWTEDEIEDQMKRNLMQIQNETQHFLAKASEASGAYITLLSVTYDSNRPYTLEKYLKNPEENITSLALWCEAAHYVIIAINALNMKGGFLTVKEKIYQLMLNAWGKDFSYEKITAGIDQYNFWDISAVQNHIANYLQNK